MPSRTWTAALAVLAAFGLAGCGGDETTGPGGGDNGTLNVSGTWTLEARGSGAANDFWSAGGTEFVVVLELTHSGTTIRGRSHSGRTLGSVIGWGIEGDQIETEVPGDSVTGSLRDGEIVLDVRNGTRETSRKVFRGTVTAAGMSGSGWSAERGGRTVPELPAAPSAFTATPTASNTIEFRWQDNSSDEDAFVFFRSRDLEDWSYLGWVEGDTESATYEGRCVAIVACEYQLYAFRASDTTFSAGSNVAEIEIP